LLEVEEDRAEFVLMGEGVERDAAVAFGQIFDAGDLAEVLEIVRITGKVIGKRDEEAHAS